MPRYSTDLVRTMERWLLNSIGDGDSVETLLQLDDKGLAYDAVEFYIERTNEKSQNQFDKLLRPDPLHANPPPQWRKHQGKTIIIVAFTTRPFRTHVQPLREENPATGDSQILRP